MILLTKNKVLKILDLLKFDYKEAIENIVEIAEDYRPCSRGFVDGSYGVRYIGKLNPFQHITHYYIAKFSLDYFLERYNINLMKDELILETFILLHELGHIVARYSVQRKRQCEDGLECKKVEGRGYADLWDRFIEYRNIPKEKEADEWALKILDKYYEEIKNILKEERY